MPGGSRSLGRRGSAVSAPLAAPRGRRAPALAARSGLGAEHSRLPRISLPASRRRLARSRLCRRQGRAHPAASPVALAPEWPSRLPRGTSPGSWRGGGPLLLSLFPSLSAASAATGPQRGRGGPRQSRGCAAPLLAEGSEGTSLLTGPEKPQRSRGEEGTPCPQQRRTKGAVSGEPGAKSEPAEAGRELEKGPATLAPAVTDLSFPAW